MKERVTLTLEAGLLRRVDATIDGKVVRNRSHAIEMLIQDALAGELPDTAVILGGGTEEAVTQVLREEDGKPIIKKNVEYLAEEGISTILIVSKETDRISEALGDQKQYDVDIQYISETTPLGTGGILHLIKPYVQGAFILTNGDEFADVKLRDLYTFHKHNNGWCTIALTTIDDPSQYGVALLNGNRIVAFVEKPDKKHAPSNLISAGLYVVEPKTIGLIPEGYAKLEYDVFPKLVKQDTLYGFPYSGEHLRVE